LYVCELWSLSLYLSRPRSRCPSLCVNIAWQTKHEKEDKSRTSLKGCQPNVVPALATHCLLSQHPHSCRWSDIWCFYAAFCFEFVVDKATDGSDMDNVLIAHAVAASTIFRAVNKMKFNCSGSHRANLLLVASVGSLSWQRLSLVVAIYAAHFLSRNSKLWRPLPAVC